MGVQRKFELGCVTLRFERNFGAFTMPMDIETYQALGLDKPVNLRTKKNWAAFEAARAPATDDQYHPCPEAHPGDDVPRAETIHIANWSDCHAFPGTVRDIWIHRPVGLDRATEGPALAFFNDGGQYLDPEGPVRAAAVLDSLIHAGEIPLTVGVFVNPGRVVDGPEPQLGQRSFEYDRVKPDFVQFIDTEIVPMVEAGIGVGLNPDPAKRLICGMSSGGICAFNAAWHSPTSFGRVISHCGSFANIHGGHVYPYLIRTAGFKPIRVFLQTGKNDHNIALGSWPIINHDVASALEYADYEYRFEFGEGGHSLRHGGALFAESLRWLFS